MGLTLGFVLIKASIVLEFLWRVICFDRCIFVTVFTQLVSPTIIKMAHPCDTGRLLRQYGMGRIPPNDTGRRYVVHGEYRRFLWNLRRKTGCGCLSSSIPIWFSSQKQMMWQPWCSWRQKGADDPDYWGPRMCPTRHHHWHLILVSTTTAVLNYITNLFNTRQDIFYFLLGIGRISDHIMDRFYNDMYLSSNGLGFNSFE